MGKLTRVLIVLCLLLSIAALVLGHSLFAKREVLKGRAQKLQTAVIQLGALIEDQAPPADARPNYPPRDISPVTLNDLDQPEYSTFWDSYSNALEKADQPTMRLRDRDVQLKTYFQAGSDGKIVRDATGMKKTDGSGTMQALLDEVIEKAMAQLDRLNRTRQQLVNTRTELVAAIQDLNQNKTGYRRTLQEKRVVEDNLARTQNDLRNAERRARELEAENRTLQDAVAEERRQVQLLEEQKLELEGQIDILKKELTQGGPPAATTTAQAPVVDQQTLAVDTGEKGTVVAVNADWDFVVLGLSETFMKELMGEDLSQPLPSAELMIKREGPDGREQFVTKVRLRQVKRDRNLAIADVLTDWQQSDVREGDVVFF